MKRHKIEIRPDRMVIVYHVATEEYLDVFNDAAGWREQGWRILSIDSHPVGYSGGSVYLLFDAGTGYVTEVRYTILYEQVDPVARPWDVEPEPADPDG